MYTYGVEFARYYNKPVYHKKQQRAADATKTCGRMIQLSTCLSVTDSVESECLSDLNTTPPMYTSDGMCIRLWHA